MPDLTADGIIHDRGRGPEIKGTRITVYALMDHEGKAEWTPERIAQFYSLTVPQVQAALDYIASHRDELLPEYEAMVARSRAGNPPEVRATLDETHARFVARLSPEQRRRLAEIEALAGENGNGTGSRR